MNYTPRLSAPSVNDKNFINTAYGGYNKCIARDVRGNVLPNCTAYAWGRFLELDGSCQLPTTDAENWFPNASYSTWGSYKTGQTPKLGAIACYAQGKQGVHSDGAGHVFVLEEDLGNGKWKWSESNYSGTLANGKYWRLMVGYPNKYLTGSSWRFQGYIYPHTDFTSQIVTPVERDPSVDQIYVGLSILNCRDGAGTSYNRLGFVPMGYYNVRRTVDANGYTWYEIDKDRWCAQVDGVEFFKGSSTPKTYSILFPYVSLGDAKDLCAIGKSKSLEYVMTENK